MGNMMRGSGTRTNRNDNQTSHKRLDEDILAVVLQDYPSPQISEPTYRIGEKLRVLERGDYWWRVCSVGTGKENYIPHSHVATVYHGWLYEGVQRKNAEELLLLPENKVGSFLVRENMKERGTYSLSVKHQVIKHYRIHRLDNSWYFISPGLTFQCLEDMISHYSEAADGLCCMLTSPCLSGTATQWDAEPIAPPVVMRRNFDWKKVDRNQLVSTDSCSDSIVSYGVRNSIAAYLSLSEDQDHPRTRTKDRKRKCKTVYSFPEHNLENSDI
ncbi:src like adaptor 1a [Cynoglossus semilaevis]|uniref:Src like adaptor 1a n=1 Tax=Cynoglossus semilaevis TaxID=244447 RepID=A0A3P8VIF6_CYNSE|nr:src-like-adapter [Cynoglossus semilaevis]XP_008330214.1 src-like-adapter [Cynoglossus semilaevis]XP_016896889.1 src-like-adapter [Cynoglossus semilaevis]